MPSVGFHGVHSRVLQNSLAIANRARLDRMGVSIEPKTDVTRKADHAESLNFRLRLRAL